jgi:hypothetical protein
LRCKKEDVYECVMHDYACMYVMQKDEKGKMGISSCIWYYAGC